MKCQSAVKLNVLIKIYTRYTLESNKSSEN